MRKNAQRSPSLTAGETAPKPNGGRSTQSSASDGASGKNRSSALPLRAVIYCRVSTKEQTQNLSLPTQEGVCRDYCEQNGFECDRVFVDAGESAKTTDRPEFQQLLTYCREN